MFPAILFEELKKYNKTILEKTKRTKNELYMILELLEDRLVLVSEYDYAQYLDEAFVMCPDPDDAAYFALALKYNIPIWSNDKRLKSQDKIIIINTEEMIKYYWRN